MSWHCSACSATNPAAEEALELALAHGLQDRARYARLDAIAAYEELGNHERAGELRGQASELARE